MSDSGAWLPPLIRLQDYGNQWERYLEELYRHFRRDFIASRPAFGGKRLGLKAYPLYRGKEATFWHFITEGEIEDERLPDLRRCERIRWPWPIIEACGTPRVKYWKNKRGAETRTVIALDDFSYVVVLAERSNYVLPWTAYCVEQAHRREKLRKEYERYTKGLK